MHILRFRCLSLAFALSASILSFGSAKADTYAFTNVGNSNTGYFVAGNDYGDYVLRTNYLNSPCGSAASSCFQTYTASTKSTTFSTTQPTLATDPNPIGGSGCSYSGPATKTLCTNGHELVYGLNGNEILYSVTGQTLTSIFSGSLEFEVLSPNGNLFLAETNGENLFVGINQSAIPTAVGPEPSSLALLGTGVLGLIGAARRRFSA